MEKGKLICHQEKKTEHEMRDFRTKGEIKRNCTHDVEVWGKSGHLQAEVLNPLCYVTFVLWYSIALPAGPVRFPVRQLSLLQ